MAYAESDSDTIHHEIGDRTECFDTPRVLTFHAEQEDINVTLDFMEAAGASFSTSIETFSQLTQDTQRVSRLLHRSLNSNLPLTERSKAQRSIAKDSTITDIDLLKDYTYFYLIVSSIPVELSKPEITDEQMPSLSDLLPKDNTIGGKLQSVFRSKKSEKAGTIATKKGFDVEALMDASLQMTAETSFQLERFYDAISLCHLIHLPNPVRKNHSVKAALRCAERAYTQPLINQETSVAEIINKNRGYHAAALRKIKDVLEDPLFQENYPEHFKQLNEFTYQYYLWETDADQYIQLADELYGETPPMEQEHTIGRAAVQTAESKQTTLPPEEPEQTVAPATESAVDQPEDEETVRLQEQYTELEKQVRNLASEYTELTDRWKVSAKTLKSNESFQSLVHNLVSGKTPEDNPDIDGVTKEEARKVAGMLYSLMYRCRDEHITASEIREELNDLRQKENELAEYCDQLRVTAFRIKQPSLGQLEEKYDTTISWMEENWPGLEVILKDNFPDETGFPFGVAEEIFRTRKKAHSNTEPEASALRTQ